jgi:hypothetical protein
MRIRLVVMCVIGLVLAGCSGFVSPYKVTGRAEVMKDALVGVDVGVGIVPNPEYQKPTAPAVPAPKVVEK